MHASSERTPYRNYTVLHGAAICAVLRSWNLDRSIKIHVFFVRLRPENRPKKVTNQGLESIKNCQATCTDTCAVYKKKSSATGLQYDEERRRNQRERCSLVDPEGFLVVLVMSRLSETQKAMFLKAALLAQLVLG